MFKKLRDEYDAYMARKRIERIEEGQRMKQKLQEAKYSLYLEYVRGYVIQWRNDFLQLQRVFGKNNSRYEKDVYLLMQANVFENCSDFIYTHMTVQDRALAEMLIPYEERLADNIFNIASKYERINSNDEIGKAIGIILQHNCIDEIVQYIDQLEAFIQSEQK